MVNERESYRQIDDDDQRCEARAQAKHHQQRADCIRQQSKDEAEARPDMDGIGEVSCHVRKMCDLLYSVLEKEIQAEPHTQHKQREIVVAG